MPNRLLREGLLESEPLLSVPAEARWLFVVILLSADDVGVFEATEFRLARRGDVQRGQISSLMQLLADADLIRLYEVGAKRYGFVPKFRQRVQIKKVKHPLPPLALYQDDPDALSKIKDLTTKTTVGQPFDSSCPSDAQPSEAEAEAEVKYSPTDVGEADILPDGPLGSGDSPTAPKQTRMTRAVPDCPHAAILALWAEVLPHLPQHEVWEGTRQDHLRARWRSRAAKHGWMTQQDGLAWFRKLFGWIAKSDWLNGRVPSKDKGRSPFVLTLEWLVNPTNWQKVIDGTYHQPEETPQ